MEPGLDLIFVSRRETASFDYNSLKTIVLGLLRSAKLYVGLE